MEPRGTEIDLETGRQESSPPSCDDQEIGGQESAPPSSDDRKKRFLRKVAPGLRNLKPKAYSPQEVWIGLLHYGNEREKRIKGFDSSQKKKENFSKEFFARKAEAGLEEKMRKHIKDEEKRIRICYVEEEENNLVEKSFEDMVLIDATFIIELFLKEKESSPDGDSGSLNKQGTCRDLVLLENQLPFFILEDLYNLAFVQGTNPESFKDLTLNYFKDYNKQSKTDFGTGVSVRHFTDLFRHFLLPEVINQSNSDDSTRTPCIPKWKRRASSNSCKSLNLPSASQLVSSGVKFELSQEENCLLRIEFTGRRMKIPLLEVDPNVESIFRNLVALEQCHYKDKPIICDYVRLMAFLINFHKDVELLVHEGIIRSSVGNNAETAKIVNQLQVGITEIGSHYNNLIRDLNNYYEAPHHRMWTSLKNEYFKTPWRGASTVAAIILLVLTAIQTICSVISLSPTHLHIN